MMNRFVRTVIVGLVAVLVITFVVLRFAYPTLPAEVLGTGGFVTMRVRDVPHPFAFERPRLWVDRGGKWHESLLGPSAQGGVIVASLQVIVRPTGARDAEYPEPTGPLTSVDEFARRYLPREHTLSSDDQATVDARKARVVTYRYVAYGGAAEGPPTKAENCQGRAAFFEDRGYYYLLAYVAGDDAFDRYSAVFERALASFKFLD